MKLLESKEFRRSVMPIVIINSIFCTGLLEYFADRSTHVIGFVYIIFVVTSYGLACYMLVDITNETSKQEVEDFELFIQHFQSFYCGIVYLLTIFAGVIRGKRMRLSMRQLENCTWAMDELGIPGSYSALVTHKYFVVLFFCSLVLSTMIGEVVWFAYRNVTNVVIILHCFTDNIPHISSLIIDFSFIFWIRYTKIKLGQLNTVLRSMLTTTIESPQHRRVLRVRDKWRDAPPSSNINRNYKEAENVRKLNRIKQIHLELIKFARNTNEAYGLHILISMTTCFLLLTTLLCNFYIGLTSNKLTLMSVDTVTYVYWICFLGLENLAKCYEISRDYNTIFIILPHATETGDILCELYEPSASKEFRDMVRDFMHQLVQNPLKFTACGFFDLDHTFISNTISTVTTYLVILIQVGNESKQSSNSTIVNSTSTI